jgi:hypothetical protein
MDRDPFGHRKYHALYFILGIFIAIILASMLSGCERGTDSKGRPCTAVVGIGVTGDACEVIEERACTGWNCDGPTDPPGCWYPESDFCYEPPPPVYC